MGKQRTFSAIFNFLLALKQYTKDGVVCDVKFRNSKDYKYYKWQKKKRYSELRGKKFDKTQDDKLIIKKQIKDKRKKEKQTVSKNILKKEYMLVNILITGH